MSGLPQSYPGSIEPPPPGAFTAGSATQASADRQPTGALDGETSTKLQPQTGPTAAAGIGRHWPRLGRNVRIYMASWVALAGLGLGYLTLLVLRPDILEVAGLAGAHEVGARGFAMARAFAQIRGMEQTIEAARAEVGQVKAHIDTLQDQQQAVMARLTSLEERLPSARVVEAGTGAGATGHGDPPLGGRLVTGRVVEPQSGQSAVRRIGASVVDAPPQKVAAVRIATGPSLDSIRLSWSLLQERHRSQLSRLEPRYIKGEKAGNAPYTLIAGPLASEVDAKRVCSELRTRRVKCAVLDDFDGEAL